MKPRTRAGLGVAALACLVVVIGFIAYRQGTSARRQTSAPSASIPFEWKTIRRFSGRGPQTTETFRVDQDVWRIRWSATSDSDMNGFMQVSAYRNGRFAELPINMQIGAATSAVSYLSGSGDYYLMCNCFGTWTLIAEQGSK